MLNIQHLKKSFPVKTNWFGRPTAFIHAVNDVSLAVKPGENLGIVGESGSGKTTIARILMNLYKADQGVVSFEGADVKKNRRGYRRSIQMVFQDPYSSLDPRMTVYGILVEGLTLNAGKYPKRSDKEARCLEILDAVGLKNDGILNRFPHEFSGGERQRIAIARALMLQPKILILDEAVSSLDVLMQDQILELLINLQKKFPITYIFISHNLKVIKKVCPAMVVMHQGKIVEAGLTDQIFRHPQHPYTQKLLKAAIHYQAE